MPHCHTLNTVNDNISKMKYQISHLLTSPSVVNLILTKDPNYWQSWHAGGGWILQYLKTGKYILMEREREKLTSYYLQLMMLCQDTLTWLTLLGLCPGAWLGDDCHLTRLVTRITITLRPSPLQRSTLELHITIRISTDHCLHKPTIY